MKRALIFVALAACSSGAAPPADAPCDLDPALTSDECAAVHAMALPPLPPARGNAKGDDIDAAALGFSEAEHGGYFLLARLPLYAQCLSL